MNRYEVFQKTVLVDYFSDDPDEAVEVECHKEDDGTWIPDMASFPYSDMAPAEARGVWELAHKYANED